MARRHRITLVVANFPPNVVGGAEVNAQLLAEYLTSQGHEVTVVTGAGVIPRTAAYRIISTPELRPRPSLIYERWWAKRTAQRLASVLPRDSITHSFDVLSRAVVAEAGASHTVATIQDVSPVCGSINRLWTDGSLCPGCSPTNLVKHCLTTNQHRGLGRAARIARYHLALPYRTELLTRYTALTTVSDFLKVYLKLERAEVIPDLLLATKYAQHLERIEAPTIICIGRLAFDKGTDLVLRALKHLPGYLARFIGSGDHQEWRAVAEREGVVDRVEFIGAVPTHSIGDWYHRGDVVVLASRSPEASSRTVLEAMSLGKAVVAPNYAGPRELITHGSTGRLFERGNAESLATTIEQAYQERRSLGSRAQAASERYHPDAVGPKYVRLYDKILS